MSTTDNSKSIRDNADAWVARMDAGPLSQDAQASFDSWIAADPRHHGAFLRAEAIWTRLDRARALGGDFVVADRPALRRSALRRVVPAGLALAASIALLFFVAVERRDLAGEVTTAIGEMRRIQLADGSTVEINTATHLNIEFDAQQRRVVLTEGEATFHVAHGQPRPFIVVTPYGTVRAVGTAFNIRLEPQRAAVLVTDGTIAVAPVPDAQDAMPAEPHMVSAGNKVLVMRALVDVRAAVPSDVARTLAWQGGGLSFEGETLAEAVAEFNRYNGKRMTLLDPSLAALRIGGYFRTSDVDAFLAALRQNFDIVPDRSKTGQIGLYRRPAVRN
jgi:transmembrane sensor